MHDNALESVLLCRDFQRCVCDFMDVVSGVIIKASFGLEQDIHMSGMLCLVTKTKIYMSHAKRNIAMVVHPIKIDDKIKIYMLHAKTNIVMAVHSIKIDGHRVQM